MGKYFGTDGIRGVAFEKLNSDLAFKLGQSLVLVLKAKKIVIGMDTRLSSPMLSYAVSHGAMSLGCEVIFAGVVSTPMIALYSKAHAIIGVMITASHNPYHDNGIKVFKSGEKLLESDDLLIEAIIDKPLGEVKHPFGQLIISDEIKQEYLKLYENLNLKGSPLKIGYDSAHGANYLIAAEVFNQYHTLTYQINHTPDGFNINTNCGSTHMDAIIEHVKAHHLDIGFSFDGDGDRVLVVDSTGKIYDGDELIYIIASYLKDQNQLKHNTVVLTKMSNPGIIKALHDKGIQVSLVDVGDKYVFKELLAHDYIIGGESSGHVIMRNLLHSGDGLLVSQVILKILTDTHQSLQELTKDLELYPLKLVNIKNVNKDVLNHQVIKDKLNDAKKQLGPHALLLVRPSGTEPLIRVTVSHQDEQLLESICNDLVSTIKDLGGNE